MSTSALTQQAMRSLIQLGDSETKSANKLIEDFLKWANDDGEEDDGGSTLNLIDEKKDLLCFNLAKTEQIVAMSERELGNYQEVTAGIEERIKQTEEDIIAAKKDLDAAKGVRRNREEYDALAKVVQKTESRQETEATLAKINKEIADLTAQNVALNKKQEEKRKSYALIMYAFKSLSGDDGGSGSGGAVAAAIKSAESDDEDGRLAGAVSPDGMEVDKD